MSAWRTCWQHGRSALDFLRQWRIHRTQGGSSQWRIHRIQLIGVSPRYGGYGLS
jgi:hypothetical protein